jgi:hypothetical protein
MTITSQQHRLAEVAWIQMWKAYWACMPSDLRKKTESETRELQSTFLTIMRKSQALSYNRVMGVGVERPATEKLLDEIISTYATSTKGRFCLFLSPAARPSNIERWLSARGVEWDGNLIKLFRSATEPAQNEPHTMRCERIGPESAAEFARVYYGKPDRHAPWLARTVGAKGFDHFIAYDKREPVAVGALFTAGEVGILLWGSTLTRHRKRGAHQDLISARLELARERGASLVIAETIEPVPGRPAGAFRNLIRAGFNAERPIRCFEWNARGPRVRC